MRLWVRAGHEVEEFEEYEREAARVMHAHGGRIERAFRASEARGDEEPFEVHLVWFPDEEALAAYQCDARASALRERRDAVIERTEVWRGNEVTYGF